MASQPRAWFRAAQVVDCFSIRRSVAPDQSQVKHVTGANFCPACSFVASFYWPRYLHVGTYHRLQIVLEIKHYPTNLVDKALPLPAIPESVLDLGSEFERLSASRVPLLPQSSLQGFLATLSNSSGLAYKAIAVSSLYWSLLAFCEATEAELEWAKTASLSQQGVSQNLLL